MSEESSNDPPPSPPLTAQPPVLSYATPMPSDRDWTTVWTAQNYFEANLAVTKLQSRGINARVDMEATDALGAWAGGGPGGARVQVLGQDAGTAKGVFEEIERERVRRQNASAMHCPRDGTPAKRVLHPLRWVGIVLLVGVPLVTWISYFTGARFFPDWTCGIVFPAIGLLIWPLTPRWKCPTCGDRWSAPAPEEKDEDEHDDDDDDA